MPAALAYYDVRLFPDPTTGPELSGVAEALEEREPDEWGEPGRVLNSMLRCIRLPHGECLTMRMGALVRDGYRYRIFSLDPRGRPRWMDGGE